MRTFSGNSTVVDVMWDGTDNDGLEVDDDAYEVVLTTAPAGGKASAGARADGLASTKRVLISKNKIGDVFLLFDASLYLPGQLKPYLNAIENKLAPSKGSSWSKLSVIIVNNTSKISSSTVARINSLLSHRLRLFYDVSHGGEIGYPEFGMGRYYWFSKIDTSIITPGPTSIDVSALTATAGYGPTTDSPGIVWIDCCKSAGGTRGFSTPLAPGSEDWSFADDFHSGDDFGVFIGWVGDAEEYGKRPAPADDWSFWRNDLWSQLLSRTVNYGTALNNVVRDYNYHGAYLQYDNTPAYRCRMQGNLSDNW